MVTGRGEAVAQEVALLRIAIRLATGAATRRAVVTVELAVAGPVVVEARLAGQVAIDGAAYTFPVRLRTLVEEPTAVLAIRQLAASGQADE